MSLGRGDSQRLRDVLDSICDSAGGGAATADSTSTFSPESCMSSSRVAEDMARVAGFAMMVEACVGELPDVGPIADGPAMNCGRGILSPWENLCSSVPPFSDPTWMGGRNAEDQRSLFDHRAADATAVGSVADAVNGAGSVAADLYVANMPAHWSADPIEIEGYKMQNIDVDGVAVQEWTRVQGNVRTSQRVLRDTGDVLSWETQDLSTGVGVRVEVQRSRTEGIFTQTTTLVSTTHFFGPGGGRETGSMTESVTCHQNLQSRASVCSVEVTCSGQLPSGDLAQCPPGQGSARPEGMPTPPSPDEGAPPQAPNPGVDSNSEACQALHGFLNERGGLDWDSYFGRGAVPPRRHYEYPRPDEADPRIAAWIEAEMGDVWCLPPTEEPESPYSRACGAMLCGLGNSASVVDGSCQCTQHVGTRMPTDVLACGGLPNCPEGSTRSSTGFGCACVAEGSLGLPEPRCGGGGGGGPVDQSNGAVICPE
jgi:hypothetical protein